MKANWKKSVAVVLMAVLLLDGSQSMASVAPNVPTRENVTSTDSVTSEWVNHSLKVADTRSAATQMGDVGEAVYGETAADKVQSLAIPAIPRGEVNLRFERVGYNEIEVKWDAFQPDNMEIEGEATEAPIIDHYVLEWKNGDTWTALKETKDDFYYLHTGLPEASYINYRLYIFDDLGNKSKAYSLRAATDNKYTKLLIGLDNEGIQEMQLSEDGSTLVFMTAAEDLKLPDSVEGQLGVYHYLVADGHIKRIGDTVDINNSGEKLAVSGDGRYVAYPKQDPVAGYQLYRYDSLTGTSELVASPGTKFDNVAISRDGSKLVFDSFSTNLVAGDTNGVNDAFLVDFTLPEAVRLKRISVTADGKEVDDESKQTTISADGHYAAFVSKALELAPGEEGGITNRLYLYDTITNELIYVPIKEDGYSMDATWPSLSADGRYIAYRYYINARGRKVAVIDRNNSQSADIWKISGTSNISLEIPKLTSNGRYVSLEFTNYNQPESPEPYMTYGFVRYDVQQTNSYRYVGKLLDSSSLKLNGDGSKGVFSYWDEGTRLMLVCLEACEDTAPTEEIITKTDVDLPQQVHGAVPRGGKITIRALAKPNLALQANIGYELADQAGIQTAHITLAASKDEARSYRADWTVPAGAKRILSVDAAPVGQPEKGKGAANTPLQVAGNLQVKLNTKDAALLQGAKANLWSPSAQQGSSALFSAGLQADMAAGAANDYTLRVVDSSGNLLLEKPGIAIQAGQLSELAVSVAPTAGLTLRVIDEGGKAVENAKAEVVRLGGGKLYSGKTGGDGRLDIPDLYYADEQVEIRIAAPAPYKSPSAETYILQAGKQQREFQLVNLAYGTLKGITKNNGIPIPGVSVKLLSEFGRIIAQTVTDAQGKYSIRAPAGKVDLTAERTEAPLYRVNQLLHVTLQEGVESELDIPLNNQGFGRIKLDAQVKNVDGSLSPIALTDWRSAVHYGLNVTATSAAQGYRISAVNEEGIPVYGTPGDRYNICIRGNEAGLSSSCAAVELDGGREAVAILRLEEAARLTGSISGADPVNKVTLSRYEGGGWMFVREEQVDKNGAYSASLPKPGRYKLQFTNSNRSELYQREVTVSQGELLRIPSIVLTGKLFLFAGQTGNGYAQSELRASAGETVTLRAAYQLAGSKAVDDAKLIIGVPVGASLLVNSVMLNGKPYLPMDEGGTSYSLELGHINPAAKGTLSYQVRLNNEVAEEVLNQLEIRYKIQADALPVNETLGTVYIRTSEVTLEAPEYISQKEMVVSGRAPADRQVLIYADEALIGSAQSTPGGLWFAKLALPEKPEGLVWDKPPVYRLTAKVDTGEYYAESRAAIVRVDPLAPAITEMTISQEGGREAVFHPEDGVSRFPFVIVPGQPMYITVNMAQSSRISNPRVSIGRETVDLNETKPGTFTAVFPTNRSVGAGVFVSYDTAAEPETVRTTPPTDEQWLAQQSALPADWSHAEYSIVNPSTSGPDKNTAYTPTYKVVYPDKNKTVAHVRLSVKPERLTGDAVPYRGFEPSFDNQTGSLIISGSISRSAISPQQLRQLEALAPELHALADTPDTLSTDYLGIAFSLAFPNAASFNTAFGIFGGLKSYVGDTTDFLDYSDQLLKFQDYVIQNECYAPNVKYYVNQTELLFDMASTGLLVKNTITGIGLIAGVALPELPAWAPAAASLYMTAINDGVMSKWDSRLEDLKKEFEADKKWRDDMAEAGAIDRCKKRKDKEEDEPQRKVADPVWIWDPSGYAYEALPGNRLEGVTATLLQENPEQPGNWSEWDADWFGQQNPLVTDPQGRYGWDVPEGNWRVLYAKDGYQPAQSGDLTVLPPHYDVNVAMVSLLPPVPSVGQAIYGKPIVFTFSKYMVTSTVTNGGVILENTAGDPILGQVAAIDPQEDASGQQLAREFRFVPAEPLTEGRGYRMRLLAHVQSYAHVGMTEEQAYDLTVLPSTAKPREAARELKALVGQRQLLAKWEPLENADGDHFRLSAVPQGTSACETVSKEAPIRGKSVSLEGLCPGTAYVLLLTTVDFNGYESTGINISITTAIATELLVDTTPPGEAQEISTSWENDQLIVQWKDPAESDLHHLQVAYRFAGSTNYEGPKYINKGIQQIRLVQLDKTKAYEIQLTSFDNRLNQSTGVTFTSRTAESGGSTSGGSSGTAGSNGNKPVDSKAEEDVSADPQQAEIALSAVGGEWKLFDGKLQIRMQIGTFDNTGKLQVTQTPISEGLLPKGMKQASQGFSVKSAQKAHKPIGVIIQASKDRVEGKDIRKLGLYRQDLTDANKWIYVGGIVDLQKSAVRAEISEWGQYAIFFYEADFADVKTHWSREEVEVLASRHIIEGASSEYFEPERKLTRAEAVKLLLATLRATGDIPAASGEALANKADFTDVPANAWYAADVAQAQQLGIIQGAGSLFRPNDGMTREELAAILYRTSIVKQEMGSESLDWQTGYKDAINISNWALPAMRTAVQQGWLRGTSPKQLAPKAKVNRSQAAVIMFRLLDQQGFITENN